MLGAALPIAAVAAPETVTGDAGAPSPPAEPTKPASSDALFSKVFGAKKQAKVRTLDLPLRINGRELGLVPARIAADPADSQIDVARLVGMLQEFTQEEPLARLKAISGADGFGSPSKLEPGGVEIRLDQAELLVDVKVPPALRRQQTLNVSTRGDAARGYLVLPTAAVSAYTNIRAAVEYLAFPADDKPDGRQPLSVSFENAVNLKGWVIEAEAFYREDGTRRWSRGPARLVHDFVEQSIRVQAGDLNYPVAVGQSGRALGGLSVSRNFSLQPYRQVQPTGRQDLILENPSTVEVLVNGQPTRTFRLDAGPYNLSNFPGTTGTNDITVRITDVYGRQQLLNFPFFFDSQLLAPGVNEFSYAVGYPSLSERDRLRYDEDKLTFSGYHRVGLSDQLTLGASVQADRLQTVAGAEALYTTSLGTFSVEPAASFGASRGMAGTLRYRDFRTGEEFWQQRTVTLQATWRDSAFATFGTTDPRNSISWDLAARLGQPLLPELTATLSARYQVSRDASMMDGYSADISLRRRIDRVGSLDVTLSKSRRTDGTEEEGAYVTLRYSLDKGRQAVGASVDTIRRERRLDWRYQDLRVVDAWNLFADYNNRAGPDRAQGSVGYTHQRFLASVRHDWSERIVTGGLAPENRTTVNVASALAFADGKVAVTRPVSNSFAIVVPHPSLAGKEIGVDPVNNRFAARSDFLGPPVVPNISAYLVRPLLLDVPDLPLGYDIGTDRPAVQPGYRTGTLVPIGTDATVALDGVLKGPDGEPAGLLSGILRPVKAGAGDRREDLRFFTNRRGRFRVDSVRPGKWELLLEGVTVKPIPVEVRPDAEGLVTLGEFTLEVLP
ncbi:MAG TPA: fimbria/pilus outer membrane usher protein [Azospirillaceae bacterium]|nr:fimbria/pilus outer membrane usher protein [Azospirillaceae bacterium]